MAMILLLVFSIFLQGALGEIACEDLPIGMCSFSIASSGKRCLLETDTSGEETSAPYQCKTSEVVVKHMPEWIESDECIAGCGVDRYAIGISSDALLDPQFTAKLCAPSCYQNCPNVVDLYYNLALGEGVFLPGLCKAQKANPRRAMSQITSSGAAAVDAASAPVSSTASAPLSSESPSSLAYPPSSI